MSGHWWIGVICSEGFRNFMILVGVVVAVASVLTARQIARKKQAADLLFSSRSDDTLQAGQQQINTYHEATDKNIRQLAEKEMFNTPEAVSIRYVLNHYEVVAVGIQAGIYDEEMLKRSWRALLLDTYDKTQPLISSIRKKTGRPNALQEFEWLAWRWQKSEIKKRR